MEWSFIGDFEHFVRDFYGLLNALGDYYRLFYARCGSWQHKLAVLPSHYSDCGKVRTISIDKSYNLTKHTHNDKLSCDKNALKSEEWR